MHTEGGMSADQLLLAHSNDTFELRESKTTKGIWLAKAAGIEPCTMDVEGTDGRERGLVYLLDDFAGRYNSLFCPCSTTYFYP